MKWYPGPSASVFNPVPIEDTFSTAVDLAHFPPGAKPITAAGFTLNSPLHDPAFAILLVLLFERSYSWRGTRGWLRHSLHHPPSRLQKR